jgi:putative ABC transport system permease protein
MSHLWRDVEFGVRNLMKHPGSTAVVVLALAIGIGGNTAIFSVVHATLLESLPYEDADRIVMVWSKPRPEFRNSTAPADYLDWRSQSTVFSGLHAWTGRSASLLLSERPQQVQGSVGTPGWISNHGLRIAHGRDFLPEEGEVGKDDVVILSHRLWTEKLGGDAGIVGRPLRIDGRPHTVVGVLARGPADRMQSQLFFPLAFRPEVINHDFHFLLVMGRLKPGVTLEQANAEMNVIERRIGEEFPASKKGWSVSVEPLKNNFLSENTIRSLWFLLAGVGFVLLIACVNVANVLLARASTRQREVALRASLGASRRVLFTQFLTESLVLAALGGALGITLAAVLLRVIISILPAFTLPSEAEMRLSVPVLLFTGAVALLSGVLFGCAPAWQAARQNLSDALKEGGRGTSGGGRHRVRRILVAAQFALALTLLAGGALAIHSLVRLNGVELGFRSERLITGSLPVPRERLGGHERIAAFYRQMLEKIHVVPGVSSAAVSTGIPVSGTNFGMLFDVVGQPAAQGSDRTGSAFNMVSPAYFETFGIPMVKGRALTDSDAEGRTPVCVVNEAFVRRHLHGLDPLAQRLRIDRLDPALDRRGVVEWQIVGVSGDVRNGGPGQEAFPEIQVPFWQSPWPNVTLTVRTVGDPQTVRTGIEAAVRSLDLDLPFADVRTMDQVVRERLAGDRFSAILFGSFAAMALLLAALGIYGVMSFVVAQRRQELGVRFALGATRAHVLGLVLKDGLATALVGTALGFVGAFWLGRAMQGMFEGVPGLDTARFALLAATLVGTAALACYLPARRASRVDPLTALREE